MTMWYEGMIKYQHCDIMGTDHLVPYCCYYLVHHSKSVILSCNVGNMSAVLWQPNCEWIRWQHTPSVELHHGKGGRQSMKWKHIRTYTCTMLVINDKNTEGWVCFTRAIFPLFAHAAPAYAHRSHRRSLVLPVWWYNSGQWLNRQKS